MLDNSSFLLSLSTTYLHCEASFLEMIDALYIVAYFRTSQCLNLPCTDVSITLLWIDLHDVLEPLFCPPLEWWASVSWEYKTCLGRWFVRHPYDTPCPTQLIPYKYSFNASGGCLSWWLLALSLLSFQPTWRILQRLLIVIFQSFWYIIQISHPYNRVGQEPGRWEVWFQSDVTIVQDTVSGMSKGSSDIFYPALNIIVCIFFLGMVARQREFSTFSKGFPLIVVCGRADGWFGWVSKELDFCEADSKS